MRILVPVDGSTNSLNAVSFIASRQTLLGSNPDIELLNIQLPLPARACRLVGQDAIQRYYEDEAEKVFEPARKILQKVGFKAVESFVVGEPSPSIAKAAEKTSADLIVILDDGRLHAVGTHDELLAKDTIYQEIYHSQMKGGDADGEAIRR